MKKWHTRGFTLTEIMVVVGIIGILSALVYGNLRTSGPVARDAERKADLREMQTALELYKQRHGRYPKGCNDTGGAPVWSTQKGSSNPCSDGGVDYIRGETDKWFVPDFMTILPTDPKLNGSNSGYMYTTNADGTVYKLMAKNTVETENIGWYHPFKSCDINPNSTGICYQLHGGGTAYNTTNPNYSACNEPSTDMGGVELDVSMSNKDTQYDSSYGVWGGYARPDLSSSEPEYQKEAERYTEDVICDMY